MTNPAGFQSKSTQVLCLIIGSGAILILGVQPLLLGALLNTGTIDSAQLGWIATIEVVAMGLGVLAGTPLLRHKHAKRIVLTASALTAVANLGTWDASSVLLIMGLRSLAGVANGVLIAISVLSITYSNAPGRMNAIFLTMGTLPQLALAYTLPSFIAPTLGVGFGFAILAAVGIFSGLLVLTVRDRFAPLEEDSGGRIIWTPLVAIALLASLASAAAIGACWAYVEPVAALIGLSPEQIGLAIAVSLLFQVLSTIVVSTVGWRIPFGVALLGGAIGQIVAISILISANDMVAFTSALALFGFLWTGCMPFGIDLIISIDTSRATAPLMLPLTFFGISLGPLIASFFVGDSVEGAFLIGLTGFIISLVLYAITFILARRTIFSTDLHVADILVP